MRLSNKTAVITGGASGIGEHTAYRFAEEGATVVILDVNETSGLAVAERIEAMGQRAEFLKVDTSSEDHVRDAVNRTIDRHRGIDILFNNAAVGYSSKDRFAIAPAVDSPKSDWDAILNINLGSVYLLSKYVIPVMENQKQGSIINNSSILAIKGEPGADAYTASKGAIVSLTRSMARQYGPHGIRVNCICPGVIRTPLQAENEHDPQFEAEWSQRIPLRRIGEPEDIAHVVTFLASDEASYLTGAVIPVDGGYTV